MLRWREGNAASILPTLARIGVVRLVDAVLGSPSLPPEAEKAYAALSVRPQHIRAFQDETLALSESAVQGRAVRSLGDYWRPRYSVPNARMVEAVQLLARTEAILLDPVYTGKAMAGLIDQIRRGAFRPDENVLFLHTGGLPALHVLERELLGESPVAP